MHKWLHLVAFSAMSLVILQIASCPIPNPGPIVYGPYGPVGPQTFEVDLGTLEAGGTVVFSTSSGVSIGSVSAKIDDVAVSGVTLEADGSIKVSLPNNLASGSYALEVSEPEQGQLLVKATFTIE
jgi:hypothetical protein